MEIGEVLTCPGLTVYNRGAARATMPKNIVLSSSDHDDE